MIPDHFNKAGKSTSLILISRHSVDHHVALHCIALHIFNEDGDHILGFYLYTPFRGVE